MLNYGGIFMWNFLFGYTLGASSSNDDSEGGCLFLVVLGGVFFIFCSLVGQLLNYCYDHPNTLIAKVFYPYIVVMLKYPKTSNASLALSIMLSAVLVLFISYYIQCKIPRDIVSFIIFKLISFYLYGLIVIQTFTAAASYSLTESSSIDDVKYFLLFLIGGIGMIFLSRFIKGAIYRSQFAHS
jgi:hypothetical protein